MTKRRIITGYERPGSLRVDHSLVVLHPNTYGSPPLWWHDERRTCTLCHTPFDVTAEQQHEWYEVLKIPLHIQINRCPPCRVARRRFRALSGRLSQGMKAYRDGTLDDRAALDVIAVIEEFRRRFSGGDVDVALALIKRLRRSGHRDSDGSLLWLEHSCHELAGHDRRAAETGRAVHEYARTHAAFRKRIDAMRRRNARLASEPDRSDWSRYARDPRRSAVGP